MRVLQVNDKNGNRNYFIYLYAFCIVKKKFVVVDLTNHDCAFNISTWQVLFQDMEYI